MQMKSKVKMVSVIVIAMNVKHLFTFIHITRSISMAVSTTSQLSVDIVATESIYCDNVQSAGTRTMKQTLIIVHIRMIGAVTILSCCSMALQIWPLWYYWDITSIHILLSYPYVCYPWILFRKPGIKIDSISNAWIYMYSQPMLQQWLHMIESLLISMTLYNRAVTSTDFRNRMAWAMRWGHGQVIACTIPQRMVWQKYFFWTMIIK